MEFSANNTTPPPKNLYPCLATITIQPNLGGWTRRLSSSSNTSGGEEEGGGSALKRIVSGGRRKSFNTGNTESGEAGNRRVSIAPPSADGTVSKGTWYWRVQAGVTDNALLLLPLSQPPNPLLTSPPQALSQAMPAHSDTKHPAHSTAISPEVREKEAKEDGSSTHDGLVDKMKNLFRKGSTTSKSTEDSSATATGTAPDATMTGSGEGTGGNDRILDQTAQGDQLPSASANAMGATNSNGSAEIGWPGVINGDRLQAVVVPLSAVDKNKVTTGGGKKEGHWVNVMIHSALGSAAGGSDPTAKTGFIRLEFDKDWIGGKAEAELLHHQLTSFLDRSPALQTFKIGGGTGGSAAPAAASGSHPNPGMDERRRSMSGGEV